MEIQYILKCLRKMVALLIFWNFFYSEDYTRDASTQTPENFLRYTEHSPDASKTSKESRKKRISNMKNTTNFSDNCKLAKADTERTHLMCSVCKRTDSDHLEVRHGKVMFRCCKCSLKYENFNYLQMHIYNKHFKCFYCEVCQLMYSVKRSHALGGMCDMCEQDFECKYQLEEHYISVHMDFLEGNCKICKRSLDRHITSGKKVRYKYQCCVRECEIRTNGTICLNEHLNTHHDLKLYKCEVCGNHFKQPTNAKEHLQDVHPLCKLCGKRFYNRYFLKEHPCEV